MNYGEFFKLATGAMPLPYQEGFRGQQTGLTILRAPTGLGKTDTVLVDWLHRLMTEPERTERRLVWCLPGRALTEQVVKVARDRVARTGAPVRICRLMGGSKHNDITLGPDETAILVGTEDLLLSRALNRGYARRPFRWPIDFALLNNDCRWVFDEVQLLGDGLATSTQLAAFRDSFGCFGEVSCCWISATFDPGWLHTVDFAPLVKAVQVIELGEEDRKRHLVQKRINAAKRLSRAPDECRLPSGAAEFAAARHRSGTQSLVVANTVVRAREIWTELQSRTKAELVLLHSRFRAADRARQMERLEAKFPPEGRVIVATQVIEAGIDLSASLLVTDVAPYSSLVQRFGRVNRYGDDADAEIFWVDRPLSRKREAWAGVPELKPKDQEQVSAPYTPAEIDAAIETIRALRSAAPADLPGVTAPPPWEHVLRRADILDLFDTSPDLAGNHIDISRFVRSGENRNVYVAWREWPGGATGDPPPEKLPDIEEAELCPVPIGDIRTFAAKHAVWSWDALGGRWGRARAEEFYPGCALLVHVSEGGYTSESGWSPDSKTPVVPWEPSGREGAEPLDDDRKTFLNYRQTLSGHTACVWCEMGRLVDTLAGIGLDAYRRDLEDAARKHDWGKAHDVMQETLHNSPPPYTELLAKQERSKARPRHSRPYFRHELASALAMIEQGDSDLAAYITAAHHGRIRLSIRSMPGEREHGHEFVRGIKPGDRLPPCELGDGLLRPEITLKLRAVELGLAEDGSPAWTDRVLRLRDTLGPFRLVYLEMLLRIADKRASEKAAKEAG